MSTSPLQPDAQETDDLVAYLDGELSADDCRRVERRLASDADYRRRLTELEQAWTALDALPPTVVDDDFARTTIEMVCVAAESDAKQESTSRVDADRRRRNWWIGGGLATALAAFAATWIFAPSRDRALVADLPVVAQLDVLNDVGDIEFLRGLEKLDIEPPRTATTDAAATSAADWKTVDERRAWIEALPPSEKADLAAKLERFEREVTPESRDRLRQLARDIDTADDRQKLEATLTAYGAWLQSRTPAERVGLRDRKLSTDERLVKVERLVEQTQRSLRRQLSLDDEKALQDAVFSLVEERRHELLDEVRQRGNPDPEQRIGQRSVAMVALAIVGREMQNDRRRAELQNRLTASLSEEAQLDLEGLEEWQRWRQLMRWVYEALAPKIRPQSLEEFFAQELNNDQREYLLGLPRAEMQEQLQQMYARSQVGLRDESVPRWPFRGPGGRGPWDRGGPNDRDRRDGRRGEFDGRRFEGPPGRRGPGRPGGPPGPLGPPPRDGQWRPPPPDGGPFGPPPPREDGPPPQEPPAEEQP
ncbi:MAG: anti-sigma factor, partial [Pirellulales bacterium]